jgi:hypothetical protein
MEQNRSLYKAFTKLAIKLAILKGKTLDQAKALVLALFEEHPFEKIIINSINNDEFNKKSLAKLSAECLQVCRDFGPDRDYKTLILMLEAIYGLKIEGAKEGKIPKNFLQNFKEEIKDINKNIDAPPLYNVLLESRSIVEWASMYGMYRFIPKSKKVQGRPVLLTPPYLGNDYSTRYVRKYLKSVGFKTYKWELGVNTINSKYLPKLVERLDEIYEKHQEKVSLVGWSGGGIFAKIIANRYPEKVEQLVTIGSPIWGIENMKTPLVKTLEFFRGKTLRERNKKILEELEHIPNVPITCIYTKTDGIVPWKYCLEAETYRNDIKNIEVFGSHMGMGANASVMFGVANSLIENIHGEAPNGVMTKIGRVFFPEFWQQNKNEIIRGLLLKR